MINYNGSESGVGAAQAWTDRRGKGKLWITQSAKDDRVEYEMEFGRFPRMTSSFNLRGGIGGTHHRRVAKCRSFARGSFLRLLWIILFKPNEARVRSKPGTSQAVDRVRLS